MTPSRPLSPRIAGQRRIVRFSTATGIGVIAVTILAVVALGMLLVPRGDTPPIAVLSPSQTAASGRPTAAPTAKTTIEATATAQTAAPDRPTPSSSPSPSASRAPSTQTPVSTATPDGAAGDGAGGGDSGVACGGPSAPTPTPSATWTGIRWYPSEGCAAEYLKEWQGQPARIADVVYWKGGYRGVGMAGSLGNYPGPSAIFLTSERGTSWVVTEEFPLHGITPDFVAATNDRLLAVSRWGGEDVGVWTSTDGVGWETVTGASWRDAWSAGFVLSIAGGTHGFVAVGFGDVGLSPWQAVVAHSPDGRVWNVVEDHETFSQAVLRDVVAYGDKYVIAGAFGAVDDVRGEVAAVWISDDGETWQRAEVDDAEIESSAAMRLLAGSDGLALVSSRDDYGYDAFASSDGFTWSRTRDAPPWVPGENPWTRVAKIVDSDGSRIVALGTGVDADEYGDAVGWVSTDGAHWTQLEILATPGRLGSHDGLSLAISPGGLVFWQGDSDEFGVHYQAFQGGWAVGE